MLRVNMNENVTVHKAPERQAAVQEKLSAGRAVGQTPATAWIPGQMEGASSTSLRTIAHHSEVVHSRAVHSVAVKRTADFPTEAVSAKRSRKSETTGHQLAQTFKQQTDKAAWELFSEYTTADNDLSFCLTIVDTCKMLEQDLDKIKNQLMCVDYNACHRHVIFKMSELYNASLRKALEFFQSQMTTGYDWVYTRTLDKLTRYFSKLGDKFNSTAANNALLKEIWGLHLSNELNYLEYLKDSPDGHCVVERVESNIKWLTNTESPACYVGLINNQCRHKIRARMNILCRKIGNSVNCSDAGKRIENVPHKAANTKMEQRKHHDLIFAKFKTLRQSQTARTYGDPRTLHDRNRIGYLQELFKLYKEYNKLVGNSHTPLFVELNRLIIQTINEVRVKLEAGIYDGDQTLKEEVSLLISDLEKEKWLTSEYKNPHSVCTQSQNTVIPAVQEGTMIYNQFHAVVDDMFSFVHDKSNDNAIMALMQLKQFLDKHGDKLEKLSKHRLDALQKRLALVVRMLFDGLCIPIINDYRTHFCNDVLGAIQCGALMCRHKDKIIELTPYVPYILTSKGTESRNIWQKAVSFAWFSDIWNLCYQRSFTGKDVDNLLDLKDAAPDLPSYIVGDYLVTALTNLFQFMLQTSPDTALIEKVTKLSEWIYYLGRKSRHNHGISQELYEYNEEWREKYIGKAGEGATTSSNTSAAGMPSSVHPGTLSVLSLETFDCSSRMRLQDVPHMQQFSTPCPAVPIPAPCGAFQQSASSIPWRTPIAQSAAESGQPPSLAARSFLPRIPAPACNRADFHQPTGSWTDPAVVAAGASQQQYEPLSTMPLEYWSGYSFSSNTR